MTAQQNPTHSVFQAMAAAELRHLGSLGITSEDLEAPFSLATASELRALLEQAGFQHIEIEPISLDVQFADPDHFVDKLEYAYGAVIPAFVEDRVAFARFVEAVAKESRDVVQRYRVGDTVTFPMHAHSTVAYK